MSRIHIYTVHINPSLHVPYEAAEFVEEGFNWKAFVFAGVWALYQRLWLIAIAIFALQGMFYYCMHNYAVSKDAYGLCVLVIHLIAGFWGNDWRRNRLKRKGFITSDIVTGDSLLRAELRFFDRYFTEPASAGS